ncbi:hypothetical protein ACLUTX_07630 [Enterobacterales bacterium AE_CKDN230030158-1A_HGKHYDSX7]
MNNKAPISGLYYFSHRFPEQLFITSSCPSTTVKAVAAATAEKQLKTARNRSKTHGTVLAQAHS